MAAMRQLQWEQRIGYVGVSNYKLSKWQKAELELGSPIVANQVRYHLLDRSVEFELLPYAQANDRVIIAYSPLAQGLFSGRYGIDHLPRGVRLANPLFTPSNMRRIQPLISVLTEIGVAHRAAPSQIALAWLIRHPNVIAIPGARTIEQVEANAAAAGINLSTEEFDILSKTSTDIRTTGAVASIPELLRRFSGR